MIPGFTRATAVYSPPYFPPPRLPPGYMPHHHAASATGAAAEPAVANSVPPQAPPPADAQLHRAIDSLALYVARNGPLVEAIARERQRREGGRQAFLQGGEGAAYYVWRLHLLRCLPGMQRRPGGGAFPLRAIGQRSAPLTAEERGALLGEAPLPSSAPSGLAGPGAAPLPFSPGIVPPAETAGRPDQEPTLRRQLLQVAEADRTRLQSLLKRSFVSGSTQELLQPNAAANAGLRPGALPAPLRRAVGPETAGGERPAAYTATGAPAPSRIVTAADLSRPLPEASAGAASAALRGLPVRRSEEWRPAPLLCKRFNVPDPYHGRPAEVHHSRFKTDHLALPDTAARVVGAVAAAAPGAEAFLLPPSVAAAVKQAQQQQQQEGVGGLPVPERQVPAAAAEAQQQAGQQSMGEPQDAAGAADAFLSSLTGMLEAPPAPAEQPPPLPPLPAEPASDVPPLPPELAMAAVPAEAVAEQRPLDLFKAIFEASDDEDDEEREDDEKAGGSDIANQQQQQALPSPLPVGAPPATTQQQQAAAQDRDASGFANLCQPDEPPSLPADAGQVAAAGASAGEAAAAQSPLPAQTVAQQGQQFDDATRARVEEALRNLKRHKKRKKEKKDKRRCKPRG